MTYRESARTTARRTPGLLLAGLLASVVTLGALLAFPWLIPAPSAAIAPTTAPPSAQPQPPPAQADAAAPIVVAPSEQPLPPPAQAPIGLPPREPRRVAGAADGAVPDGTTVFDDDIPAVANLDPALLAALREAATDATHDGVVFFVTSGWRSPAYQGQLLREAIARYGSAAEAARWVATAETSPHVLGEAIDIGPSDAAAWLAWRGAAYGLCQIYRNEPWHYELRPAAIAQGCPPMYADPTHDPRMQP